MEYRMNFLVSKSKLSHFYSKLRPNSIQEFSQRKETRSPSHPPLTSTRGSERFHDDHVQEEFCGSLPDQNKKKRLRSDDVL